MAKNITKLHHRFHFLNLLRSNWLAFVLVSVSLILAFLNYQPGTILTGWDNLHPEYNFPANIRRSIFAVWQEYQSLGLLGGHAHASDLLRQLFLYLLSFFFDNNLLRYLWTFLMLTIGPLGVYLFLKKIFLVHKFDQKTIHFASFLGGLFYLLNLSTLQQFFTPFETFTAFYGFFPYLITVFAYFLIKPSPKRFLLLTLIAFTSSPSFYTETMFVVYTLCLLSFIIDHFYSSRHKRDSLLESFVGLLGVGLPNAFWLLPVIFFVTTNGGVGLMAKINTIASQETYLRNLAYGNLNNLALLRGFWFGFLDLSTGGKFDYLMLNWRNHLANPAISVIGHAAFALVVTGIFYSFVKKIHFSRAVLGTLLICFFFLVGGGLIISLPLPIIGELFRSPFTKFSTALAFSYSVFFAIGGIFLLDLFSFLHSRFTYYLTLFTVTIALVIFMTPAFTGNLISPTMRLRVPKEYFELFDFFKSVNPSTRIANFPQHTFWGWNYYDWGYRGSGFLWYGIRQPILDRAFDVWEKSGERYYEEISSALYSDNRKEFEKLIDKYAINYLLVDRHVISPGEEQSSPYTEKLINLLDSSDKFTLEKNFGDKLLIYQAKPDPASQDKTKADQSVKNFLSIGSQTELIRPFDSLPLRPFFPRISSDQILLSTNLLPGKLTIPTYNHVETLVPISIAYRKTRSGLQFRFTPVLPNLAINGQPINLEKTPVFVDFPLTSLVSGLILGIKNFYVEIQLPDELADQTGYYPLTDTHLPANRAIDLTLYSNIPIYRLDLTSAFAAAKPSQCYTDKPNRKIEKVIDQNTISLIGTDLVGCLSAPIPQAFTLNQLLSLEFTYSSSTGTPGNASITDASLGGAESPQALVAKKILTSARIFVKPRLIPLQANLILEANETKSDQEINYQNVSINYLPQLGESNIFLNQNPPQTIDINQRSSLTVSLPNNPSRYTLTSDIHQNLFGSEARNCDNFNQGLFSRTQSESGFLYEAQNANSCDQINGKHLPHDINYAIIADVTNLTGLPPTICLENYSTRRCDVFERLIDGKQLVIQPISNPNEPAGYTLHLFNESFGSRETANLIRSITITPFPLYFLKNITLSTGSEPGAGSEPAFTSSHPNEFLYTASVDNSQPTNLNLYQTKSPYWKALEVPEDVLKLPTWLLIARLPRLYFFGNSLNLLTHDDANSWHNSWSLPAGKHNIVIFYLPQYLEFLGFILLPLPLIGALVWYLLRPKRTKP